MMTRFYCSVSQSAPTRAELYTGLLPNHSGVLANVVREKHPGVKSLADHLVPLDEIKLPPHYGDTTAARKRRQSRKFR
jgi:predicted AlkP superfamily pyrophosphatase or phosphodiesterase